MIIDTLKAKEKPLATYTDLGSNQKLWVVSKENFWTILTNILPQIGLTLLLFSFVSLSFFLILRNNRKRNELLQLKSDFISNMTHELKTPIATMSVALEAIENFEIKNPKLRNEYMQIARKETERLSQLVDKVMQVSKMSSNEMKPKLEKINFTDFITNTLHSFEPRIQQKNITINYVPPKENNEIISDSESMKMVLFNLIDNAIKYTNIDNPRIDIEVKIIGKGVELLISDNGETIKEEFRGKIFEKFYRIPEKGNTHAVKGHGLGLYIVKNLIIGLGGNISYEPLENGNRFVLKNIYLENNA